MNILNLATPSTILDSFMSGKSRRRSQSQSQMLDVLAWNGGSDAEGGRTRGVVHSVMLSMFCWAGRTDRQADSEGKNYPIRTCSLGQCDAGKVCETSVATSQRSSLFHCLF